MDKDFSRIERLPRYVFEEINQLKIQARHDGKDIIDFGMGNPDQATPVFGSTIAHGFLSLSLVAGIPFSQEIGMVLEGTKMGLNYGLDKVRFLTPVNVGSKVRTKATLLSVDDKGDGRYLVKNEIKMEIEGQEKPAYVAEALTMYVT